MNINNSKIKNGCWATVAVFDSISSKKLKKIFFQLKKNGYFARPFFIQFQNCLHIKIL